MFFKAFLIFLLVVGSKSFCQEVILFERTKGVTAKKVASGLMLAQTEVSLKSADTSLIVFNKYYKAGAMFSWEKYLPTAHKMQQSLSASGVNVYVDAVLKEILLTLVPLISPGETLRFKEISLQELARLHVVTDSMILERSLPILFRHSLRRAGNLFPLNTLKYRLVIKEGTKYFLVDQKVLLTRHYMNKQFWYFPNEFMLGALSAQNGLVKTYHIEDIIRYESEVNRQQISVRLALRDRTFISKVEVNSGFGRPVYSYWDNPRLNPSDVYPAPPNEQPGLGSYSFLPGVGIINCTLDYYLKGDWRYDQAPSFKIVKINGLELSAFQKALITAAQTNEITIIE